jgi:hypothetical protein
MTGAASARGRCQKGPQCALSLAPRPGLAYHNRPVSSGCPVRAERPFFQAVNPRYLNRVMPAEETEMPQEFHARRAH